MPLNQQSNNDVDHDDNEEDHDDVDHDHVQVPRCQNSLFSLSLSLSLSLEKKLERWSHC